MSKKDTTKYLERDELMQMLVLLEKKLRLLAEGEALSRKAEVANIRAENIRYKIQVLQQEARVVQTEAENKRRAAAEVKEHYNSYVKELAEKYDLPEHWAYADTDGEIQIPPEST